MKATKKVLSLVLALMMVFSCVTVAFADETTGETTEPSTESTVVPEESEEPEATAEPTAEPTVEPTAEPTAEPEATVEPTAEPTATPEATVEPTATPDPNAATEEQIAKLNELVETAKANIEYKGTNHTLQNYTEAVEEYLKSDLTKDNADELIEEYGKIVDDYTVVFTQMNIPYSTFYAAYTRGSNLSVVQQDVVTTATSNKFKMTNALAKGTYNDGTNICGVTMIVRMFKLDYEKIKANEGQSGDYGFTVIDALTTNDYEYLKLSVNDDGSYDFRASRNNLDANGLSIGELTTDTSYGDYQFTILGAKGDGSTCGIWSDVTYYGIILKTSYTQGYAMYALDNMWFSSRTTGLEVAFSVVGGQGLTNHGGNQFYQYDLNGQQIIQVQMITSRGIITLGSNNGANFQLTPYYTGDTSELSAKLTSTALEISGVPSDLTNPKVTITYSAGRHDTRTVVENAEIVDGKVQFDSEIDLTQKYTIKLTSDNYAQLRVSYSTVVDLKAVSAYGSTFYVADTSKLPSGDDTYANVIFRKTVNGRGGSTVTEYAYSDMTALDDTTFVYTGATAVEGDIYAYSNKKAVSYSTIYSFLGADVSDEYSAEVDAVSSATSFSSYHAKDIPTSINYGTDADGNKVITGVSTKRTYLAVDAMSYLKAVIKNSFGYELTEEESSLAALNIKSNATSAPKSNQEVKLSEATYTSSKYGTGEFDIVPDDTVEGYNWNEYWNNVYAVTISNGEKTIGAVHWIDIYGENSTSGYHYNKLQIALNNGESVGKNKATVTRFADFYDSVSGKLLSGDYTITVYAKGYDDLTATVTVTGDDANAIDLSTVKEMSSTTIAGQTYYYMTADENTKYGQTVVTTGRGPSATTVKTDYAIADLTNVEGTNIYYYCANPVTGSVYSFTKNDAVSYKDIYGENVTLDVDVVSSATNYTSYHAKDISDIVSYGTDANGNKVISGVSTEKTYTENDAASYVTAMLKKAAGVELTEEETALASLTLKANPTVAPSESTVEVKLSKVEYIDSKYGVGEFDIIPDDTVEGYVWNEYWNNVYGATISNGTETVGAVHWIDLYGENSTSGYHYNKIQLALNNGESVGANKANVTRFASFLDSDNNLKPGTYTITIKATGYSDLVATYTVPKKDQAMTVKSNYKTFTASTTANKTAQLTVSDAVGAVSYASSNSKYVTVSSKGVVTIKKGTPAGKYTVTITAAGDDTYNAQSTTVTYTVKKAQSMTVKADYTSFKRSTTANKYAHLTVSKAVGKVTYTSSNSKYVTVSSKGVVTIKKGTPKGTYKITVKAAGNSSYGSATKTVTIKVK